MLIILKIIFSTSRMLMEKSSGVELELKQMDINFDQLRQSIFLYLFIFVGPLPGPTMKCVCLVHPPTTHPPPPTHPPTTLSSEIEICTSDSPTPPNPYIFWKLVTRAIQRRQRDTNTKTMTMTNTMTKTKTVTKTKRLKAAHLTVPRPQTHTFSESSWQELFKDGNVTQIQWQWQWQIRWQRQRQWQRWRDWKLHIW